MLFHFIAFNITHSKFSISVIFDDSWISFPHFQEVIGQKHSVYSKWKLDGQILYICGITFVKENTEFN